jgi:hypothetical protein
MIKKYFFVFLLLNAVLSKAQNNYADSVLISNIPDSLKLQKLFIWVKKNAPNLREPVLKAAKNALQLAEKPTILPIFHWLGAILVALTIFKKNLMSQVQHLRKPKILR